MAIQCLDCKPISTPISYQLEEVEHKHQKLIVYWDSKNVPHIAMNHVFHSKIKQINICYHFVWEVIEEGSVDIKKIHTNENLTTV